MTHRTRRTALFAFAALLVAYPAFAGDEPVRSPAPPLPAAPATTAPAPASRPVDLAICLDTSGSMNGLIESAKQKLWTIVNDLALAKPAPDLRVSLVTYGNDGHDAARGWVQVQTPLTTDLDLVSQKLFELSTNGGTELVGRAIHTAMSDLEWSKQKDALQIVIVAGNESADQDQEVPFATACKEAIGRGVMVDAIYCGDVANADAEGWRQVARLADGHFASIDKDTGTVVVATPFDEELTKLSTALNGTYVPYGEHGVTGCANQWAQDDNASTRNSEAAATRAVSKASFNYRNGGWDLVDAVREDGFDLTKVKAEDLPEALRTLSTDELRKHLDAQRAERERIAKEIAAVSKKRQAHLTAALKEHASSADAAFDAAVRRAIREQARSKGFTFATE